MRCRFSTVILASVWFISTGPRDRSIAGSPTVEAPNAERGRTALLEHSYLPPAWSNDAYSNARKFFGFESPDPFADSNGYAEAFRERYGLHPAAYANDGLPMGLRRSVSAGAKKTGIQLDCLVCHAGSIGGKSYVGLGNTQLDLEALLRDLTIADGRVFPPVLYTLNSARGTNNAGQIAAVLLSLRNTDLSWRGFPLLIRANLPELDTPAWWLLGKKRTKYYDGRTDARAARSNMQFLLGDLSLREFKELEPTFRDIDAYIKSLSPPKYPFSVNADRAEAGKAVFAKTCARCHGTYDIGNQSYPNKVVPLDVIGTDAARLNGLSDRFVAHYNATWFGAEFPVTEPRVGYQAPPLDGIWATAPYLHNGSVPTIYHMLKSTERPKRFTRPRSTDFSNYDTDQVGWKFDTVDAAPKPGSLSPFEAKFIFDTARFGLGNQGHTFGDKLSDEERSAVIEYLKTL